MSNPFYVVAGQSNALRIAQRSNIQTYLADSDLEGDVVARTQGGTPLAPSGTKNDWYPFDDGRSKTGELYRSLIDKINAHMAADPEAEFAGLLWVQGEGDARATRAPSYEANLEQLVLGLRENFGENFVFTISQLADQMPRDLLEDGSVSPTWKQVQDAQASVAAKYDFVTLIDPDDEIADAGLVFSEVLEDGIHYANEGSQVIANAFMRQFEATGTADADTLFGTSIDDVINAGNGSDTVFGNLGNDTIAGGKGWDTLHGNAGNDHLSGGDGNDTLYGGDGDDRLVGGDNNDLLEGGTGNDVLFGQKGVDTLLGGAGDDMLSGGNLGDTLDGGEGNDLIYGGQGDDFIFAGLGSDTINGGTGIDSVHYAELSYLSDGIEITATEDGLSLLHGIDVDTLTSVEFIEFDDGVYNVELSTFQPLDDLLV